MASEPKLKRKYMWLNRKWFGGRLPPDTDVYWEATGAAGVTDEYQDTEGHYTGQLYIRLDPGIAEYKSYLSIVLLHECVHVEQWVHQRRVHHGIRFWARIVELFLAGAYRDIL
jgi:predicted SprT family Zn-dependent metalloprotease